MDWSRFSHLSFSDLSGLVSRRTVILVLMAVILYQATGIFYKVLTLQLVRMQPAPAAAGKAQTAAIPAREPADSYRIISERNLFGTTTKAVTGAQTAVAPAPAQDVALLIDLRGTVAGGPKYGFAVVEEKATKKQRLVKAGDLVAGAKVIRIKRNAIDLLVNNQERTLKIAESKEGPIVPPPRSAAADGGAGRVARYDGHQSERDRPGTPGHGDPAEAGADPPLFRRRGPRRVHNQQHQAGEPLPEAGGRRR